MTINEAPQTYATGGWIVSTDEFRFSHDSIMTPAMAERYAEPLLRDLNEPLPIYESMLEWLAEEQTPIYNQLISEFA
jgi:hypothetical protein